MRLTLVVEDKYRAAARRGAWYHDDDGNPYNPFGTERRYRRGNEGDIDSISSASIRSESGLTNKTELARRQSIPVIRHANTEPLRLWHSSYAEDLEGVVSAPEKRPATAILSPLWRRPKPVFNLPAEKDVKELLAESGLLLAAPMGSAGTRTQRPTEISVVELCSLHEPQKGTLSLTSNPKLLTVS